MTEPTTDIAVSRSSPPAAPPRPEAEYLTRRQGAEYIREVLGRPMSFSTATKLAALGEFAPPALFWGRRPLYTRDGLRAWVEARSRHAADTSGAPQPRRSRPKARPADKTTPEAPTP